ncbi:hypothetical protein NIES21_07920 [Anabaenopsis circularis NIES-21]|uniref:Uncharacterized protein n=1 Tax=Anabaenopsis circularis NIES-21 TaxID=1085406 RepID=A0A1Z4GCF6_9CYAN|nr:hypothetical protein NIES21_07920 [Anabaenopsis circularis NIES-21]
MLRHFRLHETYWFCRQCWQEMPNLSLKENQDISHLNRVAKLSLIKQTNNLQNCTDFGSYLTLFTTLTEHKYDKKLIIHRNKQKNSNSCS